MRFISYDHLRLISRSGLKENLLYIEGYASLFATVVFISDELVPYIMSRDMIFPTMRYVRPAKPQISLRICAV